MEEFMEADRAAQAMATMMGMARRVGRNYFKPAACWGAPVLLLLAIPLLWSGGWATAGRSLLSVLALVACPLGMYVMMRGMTGIQHGSDPRPPHGAKGRGDG
jgi:hypothetical protein